MDLKKIHIGTSGWSYKHWRGLFYPEKLRSADWLSFYTNNFSITEINSSFYRLPTEKTVLGWVAQVPDGFKFCPKISRYLTHMKKLHEPEEPLQRFFSIFSPMKHLLGPVLIQLPPFMPFNYDLTKHFFKLLKKEYKEYDFALEVRHDTWLENDSLDLMAKYNIAFVISQSGDKFPYSEMVTAKNIYIRFHGPAQLYASSYTEEMLAAFANKFKNWTEDGHIIWAFFNNDIFGYAFQDAKRLKEILQKI